MTLVHADSYAARPLKAWADTIIEELPDSSSPVGAARLAKSIRDFWQRRGANVTTRTEHFYHGLNRKLVVCVRSNIVNGWPDGRRM